jgi:hypothetical protein
MSEKSKVWSTPLGGTADEGSEGGGGGELSYNFLEVTDNQPNCGG